MPHHRDLASRRPPRPASPPPNGSELTGAGLAPRRPDDNRAAGVRCSEVLDDGNTGPDEMALELLPGMPRVSRGSHNRGALDGESFTPHSPLRVSPIGLLGRALRAPSIAASPLNPLSEERRARVEMRTRRSGSIEKPRFRCPFRGQFTGLFLSKFRRRLSQGRSAKPCRTPATSR